MIELEMLHTSEGDKKKKLDNTSPECRIEVKNFVDRQLKTGTALFLERGKKTYRITGYDPKKDKLLVRVEKRKLEYVSANAAKGRKTAVPPRAGG
jgi:hypothetical protein